MGRYTKITEVEDIEIGVLNAGYGTLRIVLTSSKERIMIDPEDASELARVLRKLGPELIKKSKDIMKR